MLEGLVDLDLNLSLKLVFFRSTATGHTLSLLQVCTNSL